MKKLKYRDQVQYVEDNNTEPLSENKRQSSNNMPETSSSPVLEPLMVKNTTCPQQHHTSHIEEHKHNTSVCQTLSRLCNRSYKQENYLPQN